MNPQPYLFACAFFIAMASGAIAAQTPSKVYRLGLLAGGEPVVDTSNTGNALIRSFAERGYKLGGNLAIERRAAQGRLDRLPQLADELVASRVDVILTIGYPAALAAKQRTRTIPIVVIQAGDPVASGLVASFARPGGNLTGLSEVADELSAKRLELLKEAVPRMRTVAMLWNADDLAMSLRYRSANAEARRLGITVQPLGVHAPEDFDKAFSTMKRAPPDAILMVTDVLTNLNRKRVIDYATAHRLPAIFEHDYLVRDGGLMSYGPDMDDVFVRAAGLANRILEGAKPADLPLEQPTRFRLAVNLKTAKALGVKIPGSILVRADLLIK